jgi:hypothetical protein
MTRSGTAASRKKRPLKLAVTLVGATALVAAAAAIAGPGAAVASARTAGAVTAPRFVQVPAAGRRANATAYARHLLARLRLPDGSRRLHWRRVAGLSPSLAAILTDVVDRRALFHVPEPMTALSRYFQAHPPAGMTVTSYGSYSSGRRVTARTVTFSPEHQPGEIYSAMLVTTFKPGNDGASVLRVDAQVAWFPRRGGAVLIRARDYKSVTVTRSRADGHGRRVLTLTGTRQVARLAGVYNRLHGAPDVLTGCPSDNPTTTDYRITFHPVHSAPKVVVSPTNCLLVDVTIGGHPEPDLYPADTVIAAARRALR